MQLDLVNLVHMAGWLGNASETLCRNAAAGITTSLWQGAALAGALWLGLKLAPRISAAQRFAVWAAGFAATAGLAVLSLITHLSAGGGEGGFASGVVGTPARPWLELDSRWSVAIACLWAAAAVYRAADLAIHSVRLRRLWRTAKPVAGAGEAIAAAGFSGRRRVEICTTEALDRPGVIGFFAPRILIPNWLHSRLTRGELEQIVLHESEHLRRGDDWMNLLQKVCLIALPLNPALWWMERKLCREREMACDEGVIRITRAPRAYASCLASIAERRLERGLARRIGARDQALSLGAWERRSELVGRVQGILKRRHGMNPVAAGVVLGAMGCGLALGSVELARCPQLVAFVPVEKTKGTDALALTAAHPSGVGMLAPGYYAMNAKAGLPERTVKATKTYAQRRPAPKADPTVSAAVGGGQQMAKASGAETGEQEWIVLTAWEQVQTPNVASNEAGLSGDVAARDGVWGNEKQSGEKPSNQGANSFRVTRLILRILPAGNGTAQPGAAQIRGGWFVIQL